jgi:SAM-dependent methyltransferase
MSQWDAIYERLEANGTLERRNQQHEGTAWLDEFLPLLGEPGGESLDLGCGVGSDMIRYRELGWSPSGVDLSAKAVEHVRRLGFAARIADIRERLPFESEHFALVTGRCSLHFFPPEQARALFEEIHHILAPGGKLLFIVNSEQHRAQGLQYDYRGAKRLEGNYQEIPSIGRRYLFYTPELARELLGKRWNILHLDERPLRHWEIEKRVVICLGERRGTD